MWQYDTNTVSLAAFVVLDNGRGHRYSFQVVG